MQASRCALCVCVCVCVCVWCLLHPSFLARALLVGVVLQLATSHQMSAGIHLQYAYRISRGLRSSSGTTLRGLRDRMRIEHVSRY